MQKGRSVRSGPSAFATGRTKRNTGLASFAKGGLWAYAVTILLGLLAFGTCMIGMGGPRIY